MSDPLVSIVAELLLSVPPSSASIATVLLVKLAGNCNATSDVVNESTGHRRKCSRGTIIVLNDLFAIVGDLIGLRYGRFGILCSDYATVSEAEKRGRQNGKYYFFHIFT